MNKTISLLILASAVIHAAVLGLIDFYSPTVAIDAGSLMRVSIQKPSQNSIKTTAHKNVEKPLQPQRPPSTSKVRVAQKTVKKKSSVARKAIQKKQLAQARVELPSQAVAVTTKAPAAKPVSNANSSPSALPKSVSSLLYSNLERAFDLHFYYPRIAIKRGWQGQVKISLRVEADGHLTRVRILSSSGYNMLDKAAIASIDKVEKLPSAIALLDGRSLDLVLPVDYILL